MKQLTIIITIILSGLFAYTQPSLIIDKNSGFEVEAFVGQRDENFALGISGTFAIDKKFDIGIGVSRLTNNSFEDYAEIGISPVLYFHPIRQDKFPLNMSLYASYKRIIVQSDILDDAEIEISGNSFSGGLFGSKLFALPSNLKLLPYLGFGFNTLNYSLDYYRFDLAKGSHSEIGMFLGLQLAFKTDEFIFTIDPELQFVKNDVPIILSVSLVL